MKGFKITVLVLTNIVVLLMVVFTLQGCGVYNFTGGDVGTATTFQVNYFQNYAAQSPGSTIEPGMDRDFTLALQDLDIEPDQFRPGNTGSADLSYEGEIVEYRVPL